MHTNNAACISCFGGRFDHRGTFPETGRRGLEYQRDLSRAGGLGRQAKEILRRIHYLRSIHHLLENNQLKRVAFVRISPTWYRFGTSRFA